MSIVMSRIDKPFIAWDYCHAMGTDVQSKQSDGDDDSVAK